MAEEIVQQPRRSFLGRLIRFPFKVIVKLVAVLLFILIRGRKVVIPVAAIITVGWFALPRVMPMIPAGTVPAPVAQLFAPTSPAGGGSAASRSSSAAPTAKLGALNADAVPSVDSYIKGLTQFDAKLMWGSLADEAISAMRTRGGSLDALQQGLDDAKRRGARYEDITMIGNYPLQDGRKYLFYVLSRRGFAGPDQLEQVYFVFTVNRDGKITRIE